MATDSSAPFRLSDEQLEIYRRDGHVTIPDVFAPAEMDEAAAEADAWGAEFLRDLDPARRDWYVDGGVRGAATLRKLDNPVFHRPYYRRLAAHSRLLGLVEQLIGQGVSVYFSQIFCKPPEGGGPKPVHQDNFYFGPNDPDGLVTAWIAMDEATVENGCLFFGDGTNRGPVYPHFAPAGEPYNLQITPEEAARHPMTPAPVPRGGVSFHHGNTFHQSAANHSSRSRRAAAMHYVNHATRFVSPALGYDETVVVRVT